MVEDTIYPWIGTTHSNLEWVEALRVNNSGSTSKGTCYLDWWPVFNIWDLQGEKRELTLSVDLWPSNAQHDTHTHIKLINQLTL